MFALAVASITAALLLVNTSDALPAKAVAPTCKAKKVTFDELPITNGYATSLPGDGYDYNGIDLTRNRWRYVSKGLQWNGDSSENDRPVPHPPDQQQSNIVPHSGNNAIMSTNDGYPWGIDAANYAGGHRYYDPKSLWIAPEYSGNPFSFKISCRSYHAKDDKEKVWSVPALATGASYQVKIPSDWVHMWRCDVGATNAQQIIVDDFEYCLWDFPYSTPIPW